MSQNEFHDIARLEASLWDAADNLRANSKLTAGEYCMPVLGVIFLRHATNRYHEALREIQSDQAAGRMPKRPLTAADFKKRRALLLPKSARYDELVSLPKGTDLGAALVEAMNAIERDFEPLLNQLPKDYAKFDNTLLEDLLRVFDSETLRTARGDVFGRINEYFLMKFAMQGAQDNGEFFTPPSLVQTIVNVIEPDHGIVFDPACGSGGMFVQSSHFIEQHGQSAAHRATFYGQEYKTSNLRLAKMNLAVHALEGDIVEANTFYADEHELCGKCDFVMANPPFNVDKVDAEKIEKDVRLPFGLPGVNKEKKVSNGNYLWISYFWSYLNATGRAGFVMSSQASSAGHGEAEIRRKLVETGDVDVMISIRSNFFYTRTVPCELWFFDRAKPSAPSSPALLPAGEGRKTHYRGGYDFSGLLERARELRKKQTPAEDLLWELIRNRQLADLKFRRQHQIGDYIVDFYCHESRLVVELEGGVHDAPAKARQDATRQKYLESLGNTVVRFRNEEVVDDTNGVLARIANTAHPGEAPSPVASRHPLPLGEGRGEGEAPAPVASRHPLPLGEGRGEGEAPSPVASRHPLPLGEGRGEGDVALNHKGNVLMLDARHVYRKVTRKVYDFSPEQLQNLTSIVCLYRGENDRFAALLETYRNRLRTHRRALVAVLPDASKALGSLASAIKVCHQPLSAEFSTEMGGLSEDCEALTKLAAKRDFTKDSASLPDFAAACRALVHRVRAIGRVVDLVATTLERTEDKQLKKDLKAGRERTDATWAPALAEAEATVYLTRHLEWLLHRFPKGRYVDVPGLCKVATRADIAAADWSLTPGRYVGVAPAEVDDDFDFEQTMRDLHVELTDLDNEAAALAKKIQKNFAGLGA